MIFSAKEDLKNRTLKALPTLIQRLAYLCSLRRNSGGYEHWGMTEKYGEARFNEAARTVHTELATEASRAPLREMYRQFEDEKLSAETLKIDAPSSDDELLSAHLHLLQDAVVQIAEQEQSSPQDA